eukprot:gene11431-23909_t
MIFSVCFGEYGQKDEVVLQLIVDRTDLESSDEDIKVDHESSLVQSLRIFDRGSVLFSLMLAQRFHSRCGINEEFDVETHKRRVSHTFLGHTDSQQPTIQQTTAPYQRNTVLLYQLIVPFQPPHQNPNPYHLYLDPQTESHSYLPYSPQDRWNTSLLQQSLKHQQQPSPLPLNVATSSSTTTKTLSCLLSTNNNPSTPTTTETVNTPRDRCGGVSHWFS